ncbi:MAG TPA: hypothetical protein VKM94_02200 [Blastocatellia bacterium]|nr:hypothetical protein [Blastocatellia bacterium]
MNIRNRLWLTPLVLAISCQLGLAQAKKPAKATPPAESQPAASDAQQKNIQAYIELIRSNVRQEKAQLMGEVMLLSAADASKFWPIYSEYDDELYKLNNLRRDNIQEYARSYASLTDAKADELIKNAMDYQRQRSELLGKYYERFKQALGAITAARFVQVEHQLLLIIDLQIAASLPIVGEQ